MNRSQYIVKHIQLLQEEWSPRAKKIVKYGVGAAAVAGAGYLAVKHGLDTQKHNFAQQNSDFFSQPQQPSGAPTQTHEVPYEHTPQGHDEYQGDLRMRHSRAATDVSKTNSKALSWLKNKSTAKTPWTPEDSTTTHNMSLDMRAKLRVLDQIPHREFAHYGM